MLRNYLTITLRIIRRHKLFSFINIAGLAAGFAFRIELEPRIFLFSAGILLAIAVGTVSFQTLRAAHADPAASLRRE